ncbi:MAG: hypothetical protein GPOALKHO_001877 [Sodalis sp.]|nr:MAG: hypothetical protein GPOALKHO_001877 [Sodalis sp.]
MRCSAQHASNVIVERLRQAIVAALFTGADDDFAPLLQLLFQPLALQLDVTACRKQWRDYICPNSMDFWIVNSIFTAKHHLSKVQMPRRFAISVCTDSTLASTVLSARLKRAPTT